MTSDEPDERTAQARDTNDQSAETVDQESNATEQEALADCPDHPDATVTVVTIAGDPAAVECDECGRQL